MFVPVALRFVGMYFLYERKKAKMKKILSFVLTLVLLLMPALDAFASPIKGYEGKWHGFNYPE